MRDDRGREIHRGHSAFIEDVKPSRPTTPTTPLALRIASIVHRQPSTPWSDKEIDIYKKLYRAGAFNETALALVERYQAFHRYQFKKGRPAFHRRGLYTLLRHWGDEVDRATDHDEAHPVKTTPRKIIPLPLAGKPEPELIQTPEDIERVAKFEAELDRRNPNRPSRKSPFQQAKAIMDGTA